MQVRILSCSGSELGKHHPISFLINGHVLIEMGSAASQLSLQEQVDVTDVLLSHAHLDHCKDLAFFAENIFEKRKGTVEIHASQGTLDVVSENLMNDKLWPDFTKLPDTTNPVLRYAPIPSPGESTVASLSVQAVPVTHPGGCDAFLVFEPNGGKGFLYSADTGPTQALWQAVSRAKDRLSVLFVEASFPNRLEALANVSGHLTPKLLAEELAKEDIGNPKICVHNLKAPYRDEILEDLDALNDSRIQILKEGEIFDF